MEIQILRQVFRKETKILIIISSPVMIIFAEYLKCKKYFNSAFNSFYIVAFHVLKQVLQLIWPRSGERLEMCIGDHNGASNLVCFKGMCIITEE